MLNLSQYQQNKVFKHRLLIFISTTIIFFTAFVFNIIFNEPLYHANLNLVPQWQSSQPFNNQPFIIFMNIVSNIFNPVICAGYILLFFLISYRKLQILIFLIWFIFLSWILSLLKMIFHQARPYWIQNSGVQMLEWTCYTEFGLPSGHAMMGVILMEFIVRFFKRVNKFVKKYIIFFYILLIIFEITVMFSRVILGMHSLNQVLFGFMIGCYSFVPYYLYVENWLLKFNLRIFKKPKQTLIMILLICVCLFTLSLTIILVLLIPNSDNKYTPVINSFEKCKGFKEYKSFEYRCLQDSALLMAAIGIIFGFNLMKNPSHLNLELNYTRKSLRFIGKTIITLIIPLVILLIFVNPLWQKINTEQKQTKALIIWMCQVLGFFSATFTLIYIIPILNNKFGFQIYKKPLSYIDYKKYQLRLLIESINDQGNRDSKKTQDQILVTGQRLIIRDQLKQSRIQGERISIEHKKQKKINNQLNQINKA